MNEDAGYRLLVSAVTDLLTGQEQQSQKTAHLAEGLKQLADGVQQLARSVSTLHDDSRQQEERLSRVLEVLRAMGDTSVETQKRLARLEADVEELKRKAS